MNVLIVTDNQYLQSTLQECFAEEGCQVLTARHIGDAFYELTGQAPEVLVVDMGSESIHGEHVLKYATMQPQPPATTILVDDPFSFIKV